VFLLPRVYSMASCVLLSNAVAGQPTSVDSGTGPVSSVDKRQSVPSPIRF
jgi:hypothetical protein